MSLTQFVPQRMTAKLAFLPAHFWLVVLASTLYFFATQMLFPLAPLFITEVLKATPAFIGTSVLVVSTVEVMLRLPMGGWSDRYNRPHLMIFGALLGVMYLVVTALSTTMEVFLLARVFHGLSLAVYVTVMRGYISDIVPPDRSGEALGINTSAFAIALCLGPLAGEALKTAFDYRLAFWMASGVALLATGVLFFLPHEAPRSKPSYSLIGGMKEVMSRRGAWAALVAALTGGVVFTTFFIYFPSYAKSLDIAHQAPAALGPITISLAFSLFAIVNFFALSRAGRVSDQRGRTAVLIPCLVIMALGLVWMALSRNIWLLYAGVMVLSMGFSGFRAMMDALMQDASPRPLRGTAMALVFAVWGASIGSLSQIFGLVVDAFGYGAMFALALVLTLIFGGLCIWLSSTTERERVTLYKGEFPPLPSS